MPENRKPEEHLHAYFASIDNHLDDQKIIISVPEYILYSLET